MTFPTKPLRIMRDPYGYHHGYEKGEITKVNNDSSLMSPPLTPTEAHLPTESLADDSCWLQSSSSSRRKEFIHSYSKMVPYLRKANDSNHGSTFALNVYRDIMLTTKDKVKNNNNNKIKEKNTTCVRLDETVVPLSRKRTSNEVVVIEGEEEDKKKVFKKKRVSSVLPTGKEAAMAFDAIDIDSSDQEFYPTGWVPFREALDRVPVKVCWKGAPLSIHGQPYYNELHPVEASMASILRLSPVQYLRCKRTLILAARTLQLQQIPFTKSVAQKLCRVDVNKTSALWTAFGQLGWFHASD